MRTLWMLLVALALTLPCSLGCGGGGGYRDRTGPAETPPTNNVDLASPSGPSAPPAKQPGQ